MRYHRGDTFDSGPPDEPGFGRGGGDGPGGRLRRFFERDNPLDWSLTLYRAWGVRVRLHLFFIAWIVIELIRAAFSSQMGVLYTGLGVTALFALVLLHEYGHIFACRRVGGEADDIVLWPLGGLASCMPPHEWKANLITTAGGPLVNVALAPLFGGAMLLLGHGPDVLFANPFAPSKVLATLTTYGEIALYWLYLTNLALLAFNVLLPMYPMDGGRLLQAVLWRSLGYRRATGICCNVGLVGAVVLGLIGLSGQQGILVALALFGGLSCWNEKQRLKWMGDEADEPSYAESLRWRPEHDRPRSARGPDPAKLRAQQEAEQVELDRLLAKIAAQGMASLTRREKRWLEQASQRRRGA